MAATGVVSGKNATIEFDTGYVEYATAWTLNINIEAVDTTALGDTWKSFITGVQEWSGTYTCRIDSANFGTGSAIGDLGVGETAAAAAFTFDDASTDGEFTGSIIITSVATTVQLESGASEVTFNFQGSGALSIVAAA